MRTLKYAIATAVMAVTLVTPVFAQADRDCSDFNSWREAQEFFERSGPGDPHRLDADNDGIACESLN